MKNLILLLTLLITTVSFSQTESQVNREETRTVDGDERLEATQPIVDYETEIFKAGSIEVNPEYPGGPEAIYAYLKKKIKVSKEELEKQGSQKVFAQFVIERNGRLSDIKVLRSNSEPLSQEFIKALKTMPKWNSGKQNNKFVRTSYILPYQPNK